MGPMLMQTPPSIGSKKPKDIKDVAQLGWTLRKEIDQRTVADITRLFTMSATDLLDRWFESPVLKGFMAVNGIIGTWAGPDAPGTAYVLMHHSVGDIGDGQIASWGYPEGGMGAVSDACADAARFFGAEIRVNARVSTHRDSRTVASSASRSTAARNSSRRPSSRPVTPRSRSWTSSHADRAPRRVRERHHALEDPQRHGEDQPGARRSCRSSPPTPGSTPTCTAARSRSWTTSNYLEKAFQEARFGKAATLPFSDTAIPTVFDKTLAPEGTHVMSMFTQWVPQEWADEDGHEGDLEAYADRLIDRVNAVAPNFKGSITHRQIIGPKQMQDEWGLMGGNIFHGELTVDQLFHMRPAPGYADYRTPIRGLYQASSATHAGGGVTGMPGHHCVREILKDKAIKKRKA